MKLATDHEVKELRKGRSVCVAASVLTEGILGLAPSKWCVK